MLKTAQKKVFEAIRAFQSLRFTILILILALVLTSVISFVLYKFTEKLLTERLQNKLIATASTAATLFDSEDISEIHGPEDMNKLEFEILVENLNKIRDANENIRFVYLMRRTSDPNTFEFIADADSLVKEDLDTNENGIIDDDEQPPLPGDAYPAEDYPVLRDEAFYHPSVDRELQPDQWGLMMAAYAPIHDQDQNTVAIIGMDILVDDFKQRTQETLLPFLLFVFFLISLITFQTLLLSRSWNERVQALRELDRQKDELLGIVSHQLATPISALKWDFEMLIDGDLGKLSSEQKDFFEKLQGVTRNLADLVTMILDVSRIQLGRMKVDATDLNLKEFFGEILNVMGAKSKERGVKLISSISKDISTGYLDRRLMHMIVENLMSNAIKYTPENGSVNLKVETEDGILKIAVNDTGCGIPKQDQDKIFGKLYRASNVRNIDGNGFGLYVVKGAVEAQGGRISFTSKEKEGTSFIVQLPLASDQATK